MKVFLRVIYIHLKNLFISLFLFGLWREEEKLERYLHLLVHSPHGCNSWSCSGLRPGSRSKGFSLRLPCGCRVPRNRGYSAAFLGHQQGAGSEADLLGPELAPIWGASTLSRGWVYYTMVFALSNEHMLMIYFIWIASLLCHKSTVKCFALFQIA